MIEHVRQGNAFRDGRVHIAATKCSTCIFRPGNLMHLAPGRLADMVSQSVDQGGVIVCHKTLAQDVDDAVCRGFHDSYADQVPALRLAHVMRLLTEVDVDLDNPPTTKDTSRP